MTRTLRRTLARASTVVAVAISAGLVPADRVLARPPQPETRSEEPAAFMSAVEVAKELTAKELAGVYPSGFHWREQVRADGSTHYREDGVERHGRWKMNGEAFCFTYDGSMAGGCFRVLRKSVNCYDLFAEKREKTVVPDIGPPELTWNGIMWRAERPSSCDMVGV